MIIRYSYRKTGYKNNNSVVNNKDVKADYGNTACDITKFFLFCMIFHCSLSIRSCVLSASVGSRKIVLSSTNKPERLSP